LKTAVTVTAQQEEDDAMTTREQDSGYFGLCPHCRNNDGHYNVGRSHWNFCDVHKTKWLIGWNLFTVLETEDEQRQYYDAKGFGKYQEVEPVCPPSAPDGSFQPEPGTPSSRWHQGRDEHAAVTFAHHSASVAAEDGDDDEIPF
jgi:hypothetical protein